MRNVARTWAAVLAAAWLVAGAALAPATAQGLDPASAQALAATLRMLQDPALRSGALAGSGQASAIDRQMQGMLTPELQQEFYAIAAEIFADLVRNSAGDPGKLGQALEAGRGDPAAFTMLLSASTLERLRAFSAKVGAPAR